MGYLDNISDKIKAAAAVLSATASEQRNDALYRIVQELDKNREYILKENERDVENAISSGMSAAMIDRLRLTDAGIDGMMDGIRTVIGYPDPIGRSDMAWTIENGLFISRISVPLGVLAIIYEGRPNVTADALALALKSGNAIVLRGSASAIHSNLALENVMLRGIKAAGLPGEIIHLVKATDRAVVKEILTANHLIDLAIPRGGAELINMVVTEATVPTLQTGEGNNHIYVDETADIGMAVEIIKNAKLQRPGTCNSVEKLLLHKSIAAELLNRLYTDTCDKLSFRADDKAGEYLPCSQPVSEEELSKEYLDYVLGVLVVDSMDAAIEHINRYGTKHSEAIITDSLSNSVKFQRLVDAAAVYVNASTRFTDGGQFGFGLEMGISTQKMHARGPVGLSELVSYKYLIQGEGQIRS